MINALGHACCGGEALDNNVDVVGTMDVCVTDVIDVRTVNVLKKSVDNGELM